MSQTNEHHARARAHGPVKDLSSPQLRTVRKELLLLRAEVERSEFVHARRELHHSLSSFGWLKLFVPGFSSHRSRAGGKSINASLTDWFTGHPLVSSLASLILAKPLRATLAAGTKPLIKWGSLGAAAWAGYRFLAQAIHREHARSATQTGDAP
jgi:hypothetical protein